MIDWKEIERLRREEQNSAPIDDTIGSTSKSMVGNILPLTGSVPPEVAAGAINPILEATSFTSRVAGQAVQTGQDLLANKFSSMAGADPSLNTDVNVGERFSSEGLQNAPTLGKTIMDAGDMTAEESARIGSQSQDPVIQDIMQDYLPGMIKISAAVGAMAGEMLIPVVPGAGAVKGVRGIVRQTMKEAEEEALSYAGKNIQKAEELRELFKNQYPELSANINGQPQTLLGGGQKESLGDLLGSKFEQQYLTDVGKTKELPLDFNNPNDIKAINDKLKSIGFDVEKPVGGLDETIYDKIAKDKNFYRISPNKKDIPLWSDYMTPQNVINKIEVEGLPVGRTIVDEILHAKISERAITGKINEKLTKAYSNLSQADATKLSQALGGEISKADTPILRQALKDVRSTFDESFNLAKEGSMKSGKAIQDYVQNYFPKTIPTHYLQKIMRGDPGINDEVWSYLSTVAEEQGQPKFVQALLNRMKGSNVTWKAEKMADEKIVANLNFPRTPDGSNILEDLMKHASKEEQLSLVMHVTNGEIKKAYIDQGLKNINELMDILPSGAPTGTVRAREYVQGVVEEAFGLKRVSYSKAWQGARDIEFVNKFLMNPMVGMVNLTQLPLTIIPDLGFKASMKPIAELTRMSASKGVKQTRQFMKDWAEKMGVDKIENPFVENVEGQLKKVASITSFIGPSDRAIAWYSSYAKYLDDIEKGIKPDQAIKNARQYIGTHMFTSQVSALGQLGVTRGTGTSAEVLKTAFYLKAFELKQLGLIKNFVDKAVAGDIGPLAKYMMVSQAIGGPQTAGLDYIAMAAGMTSGDDSNRDRIVAALSKASVAATLGMDLNSRMGFTNTFRYKGDDPLMQWLTSSPVASDIGRMYQSYNDYRQGRPMREIMRNLAGINPFIRRGVDLADAVATKTVSDLKGHKLADFDPSFWNIVKTAFGGVNIDPAISSKRSLEFDLKKKQKNEGIKKSNSLRKAMYDAVDNKDPSKIIDWYQKNKTGNKILDGRLKKQINEELENKFAGGFAPQGVNSNTLVEAIVKNNKSLSTDNLLYLMNGIKPKYLSVENRQIIGQFIQNKTEEVIIENMKKNKEKK